MIEPREIDRASPAAVPASGQGMRKEATATLRAAIALLTRLPAGETGERTGARAYAIVGALIGTAGAAPLLLVGGAAPVIGAALSIAAMTVLTGAIHLDGLADTADALAAIGPDAAERARKDPAIGAAGATALLFVLGLEAAALTALLEQEGTSITAAASVVAAMTARLMPVVLARLAPSATIGGGMGGWFALRVTRLDAGIALATGLPIVVAVSAMLGRGEPILWALGGGAIGLGLSLWLLRARRRLDGDLLGAGTELGLAATLVVAAVMTTWPAG